MLHETTFQIIKIYAINGPIRASELLWHKLLKGWCDSDVDSEKLSIKKSIITMIPVSEKYFAKIRVVFHKIKFEPS
jgi:hypothetical protein